MAFKTQWEIKFYSHAHLNKKAFFEASKNKHLSKVVGVMNRRNEHLS